MKLSDRELQEIVHAVLRRCPFGDDEATAGKIVDAIIAAEIKELKDLKVTM